MAGGPGQRQDGQQEQHSLYTGGCRTAQTSQARLPHIQGQGIQDRVWSTSLLVTTFKLLIESLQTSQHCIVIKVF